VLLTVAIDALTSCEHFAHQIGSCRALCANANRVCDTYTRNYTHNPVLSCAVFVRELASFMMLMCFAFLDNGSQVAERIECENAHTPLTSNNGSLQVCKTDVSFSGWIIWGRLLSWTQYQDWLQSWNATGNERTIAVYRTIHWLYVNSFHCYSDFLCLSVAFLAAVGWFE
jgi:hypothetical protein